MGVILAIEHGAADWSTRPLPQEWLTYAALDVELLIELRNIVEKILIDAKKDSWAADEFSSILLAPPSPPRVDPWRRTSGMHKIKRRDQLAVIRELWITRDELARASDIAGGKILNDSAIIELAINPPKTKKEFEKTLRPIGLRARWLENLQTWLDAIARAVAMPESQWPAIRANTDTLPPIKLWRDKFPEKFAPLSHARALIEIIAEENSIPVENLITPELVRRICWSPPPGSTESSSPDLVRTALLELGARTWQVDLVAQALAAALLEKEPLVVPEALASDVPESTADEL
jgi:ribonuclease D